MVWLQEASRKNHFINMKHPVVIVFSSTVCFFFFFYNFIEIADVLQFSSIIIILARIDFQNCTYLNDAVKLPDPLFLIGVSGKGGKNGIVFNNLGVTKGTSERKFLIAYIIFVIALPKYTWVVGWGLFHVGLFGSTPGVITWLGGFA